MHAQTISGEVHPLQNSYIAYSENPSDTPKSHSLKIQAERLTLHLFGFAVTVRCRIVEAALLAEIALALFQETILYEAFGCTFGTGHRSWSYGLRLQYLIPIRN